MGTGLLPFWPLSQRSTGQIAAATPDAGQRLSQEMAAAHTRDGGWFDRSALVSARVTNVPGNGGITVSRPNTAR
jgi:hypothetical protein